MQLNVRRLSASFWAGAAVVVLTGFLYLATLQHDINGADGPYTPDVGEIVNALNLWGTLHQAGYPVFSVMGSAFVTLVRLAGIPPAMAASLWSWVWGLATVGLTYGIALRLTGRWPIASGAAMLYAVSRSLWVNASIAELHTFSMALAALAMLLAFRIADGDHDGDFRWLAFVLGLAVSHQRALILLAPSLAVLLWQPFLRTVRRSPAQVLHYLVLFLLPWVAYIYLPLRVRMGAEWTFGQPDTWERLRPFITADETRTNVSIASSFPDWIARTRLHLQTLNAETLPGLIPAGLLLASLSPALARRWKHALALAWLWLPFVAAAYVAYVGYVWDAYLAVLMPATFAGALGLALAAQYVADRWRTGGALAALTGLALAIAATAVSGYRYVADIQQASRGREVIETFRQARLPPYPGRTVYSATWGLDYFALAYGALVTGELRNATIVDQTAPFGQLAAAGNRIVVLPRSFYVFGLDFWDGIFGRAHLSSIAPGLVQVAPDSTTTAMDAPAGASYYLGDSISLAGYAYRFTADALHVTLYWQASQTPSRDYSVFVHLSDAPAVVGPEDIVAQSDSVAPVYGLYPTTRWVAGELVREDYVIALPGDRTPLLLRTGLYTRDADGSFENLGEVNVPLDLDKSGP